MLIRCEKCSTLYELDEKLLPPQGAPVQCSKCQFVFKAYPPSEPPAAGAPGVAAGEPPAMGVPEPDEAPGAQLPAADEVPGALQEPPPRAPRPERLVREGGALAGRGGAGAASVETPPLAAGGDEPRFTADGRPIRKVPFPTAEAAPPGVRPTAARVTPARGAGGLDAAALMRWIIVAVVLVAIAIGAALAWRTYRARSTASAHAPAGQSEAGAQGGTTAPQPRN